jgi:hypothetical protein
MQVISEDVVRFSQCTSDTTLQRQQENEKTTKANLHAEEA